MEIDGLTGSEIGFLRSGGWAATQSALASLHRRGALRAGTDGRVSRLPVDLAGPDPLERALYAALSEPLAPRSLPTRPRVRSAIAATRKNLVDAGLIRSLRWRLAVPAVLLLLAAGALLWTSGTLPTWAGLPLAALLVAGALLSALRRTVYGARAMRRLRTRYVDLAHPADVTTLSPAEVAIAVGVYGERALSAVVPEARDAGLVSRVSGLSLPAQRGHGRNRTDSIADSDAH